MGEQVDEREVTIAGDFTAKSFDADEQLIFGWANVSVRKDGTTVIDADGENAPIEDLEAAAYLFVLKYRETDDSHTDDVKGHLVESMVFTKEKCEALGIPEGTVHEGWWVGFHLADADDFAKVKQCERRMFSIFGTSVREPVAA